MKNRKSKLAWILGACFLLLVSFAGYKDKKDKNQEGGEQQEEKNQDRESGRNEKTTKGGLHKYTYLDFAMGTVINQTVYSSGKDRTADYLEKLWETEEKLISWRKESSEIAKINKEAGNPEGTQVSEKMAGYLAQTLLLSKKSKGKLDPTIGSLSRLWNIDGEGGKEEIPSQQEIERLLDLSGYEKIQLEKNCVKIPEQIRLDLGAVGKGIGCDEIRRLLKEDKNVAGAVISVGGSILTYGESEDGSPWTIAVAHPRNEEGDYLGTIAIEGETFISTSGDYEKYFIKNKKRYHHILDPDTGYPAESGLVSATVLCDCGLLSDGLSTACFVMGKDKALELLEEYSAEGILVGDKKQIYITNGIRDQFTLLDDSYQIVK